MARGYNITCTYSAMHTEHLVSSIEGYLLRIGDQSRVYVPEVSISPGLLCYQLPERGREELEYVACHYDDTDPQHARIVGEVTTFLRQASESR